MFTLFLLITPPSFFCPKYSVIATLISQQLIFKLLEVSLILKKKQKEKKREERKKKKKWYDFLDCLVGK